MLGTLQWQTPVLWKIILWSTAADHKYQLVQDVLYCKQNDQTVLKPMLSSCIREKVTEYTHNSSGHSRIDKCIHQIKWECHIPNLAHKLNKSVACRDTCEEVKHLYRLHDMEHRSHLPSKPEELCAIDLSRGCPIPYGVPRRNKCVKLYLSKRATTNSRPNKLINHYFIHIIKPDTIL